MYLPKIVLAEFIYERLVAIFLHILAAVALIAIVKEEMSEIFRAQQHFGEITGKDSNTPYSSDLDSNAILRESHRNTARLKKKSFVNAHNQS